MERQQAKKLQEEMERITKKEITKYKKQHLKEVVIVTIIIIFIMFLTCALLWFIT